MRNGKRRLQECETTSCYAGSRSPSERINCRRARGPACWQPGIRDGGSHEGAFAENGGAQPLGQRAAVRRRGQAVARAFAAPRTGFFPSLLKTLNHILVGDQVWIGRLDGTGSNITSLDQVLHTDLATLKAARIAMDNRIVAFVDAVAPAQLEEDLVYRTMAGDPMRTQVARVLAHFFNHQTHHRGQAHAMLSSTEVAPPSLDLILFLRDHPEIASMR
jgi:uncharacterized damage-inducible protein DinB